MKGRPMLQQRGFLQNTEDRRVDLFKQHGTREKDGCVDVAQEAAFSA